MADVLVVGLGSELRGDDAVGRDVAAALDRAGLFGVEVCSVIQLGPELAPRMHDRHVVFVDASVDAATVTASPLEPAVGTAATSHHLDPSALVSLAEHLGWPVRSAHVVAVPVTDLSFGDHRSVIARAMVPVAVAAVTELCRALVAQGAVENAVAWGLPRRD